MSSVSSSPEIPRKLLRWTDSSELEDVPRERPSSDDTLERPDSDSALLSKREDWYGSKVQRLKGAVEQLRKDLQNKERDYIRLKNKYNVTKRRQAQLQDDVQKYVEVKLDLDSDLELLRLQLAEKDKELSVLADNGSHFKNGDVSSHLGSEKNGGSLQNGCAVKDYGIDDLEDSYLTEDSIVARLYLNLRKETRKLLTYILLCLAIIFSLVALGTRSATLSTFVVGLWTVGVSCLWLERKQLFKMFKLRYMYKIREMSMENSRYRMETSKLESKLKDLDGELTNEKQEREGLVLKLKATSDKLAEEMSKNEELVKLEKSTFEELQSERVRRRRAEEKLEEVSAQVLLAQEKDEALKGGDVCQELRNNLKLEREAKEKLSRENERLIKEIVEMNMTQEKERLKQEGGTTNEETENTELPLVVDDQVTSNVACNLRYSNKKPEEHGKRLGNGDTNEDSRMKRTEDQAVISNEDVNNFDSKECESRSGAKSTENAFQAEDLGQNGTQGIASSNSQNTTKDCWLCAWNIPNETSLALVIIIVACLALVLKVVLTNNVYMFVILMAVVGCFTYYQVAWNIEHSN